MLLPDNIQPELSIYYNGALIIEELMHNNNQPIIGLYHKVKESKEMSFPTFILCLDWLYLIEAATINEGGCVVLCI
jgi:hypothetical protein